MYSLEDCWCQKFTLSVAVFNITFISMTVSNKKIHKPAIILHSIILVYDCVQLEQEVIKGKSLFLLLFAPNLNTVIN